MPELPEIATLVADLRRAVVGKEIVDVHVAQPKALNMSIPDFTDRARGRVMGVERKGKVAILCLPHGQVRLHLGLGGTVQFLSDAPWPAGQFVSFRFAGGGQLVLDHVFMGRAHFFPTGAALPDEAAIDALDPALTEQRFAALLARKPKLAVKALLMDQAIIAGIGNTYSDEILHRAHLPPTIRAGDLSEDQVAALCRAMGEVLREAADEGGEADWHDFAGRGGRFLFAVHGKKQCGTCGGPVESISVGSRTSYYCPSCQRNKGA